ncbi:MAG: FAD-binding protein [Cytophagaceae bacterium]|nr:FAD-binding protein [Cytophagaceae bacterium]MDW8457081.1 FAD-linked oxidase C-terminal domain-containing protein [Cytophagaceae bacterium]
MIEKLRELQESLEGDVFTDLATRTLYATDASVYRELPIAVARPKHAEDVKKLIAFATQHKTSLIPRTAGTSLGGQVVGSGIVVDVSYHFTEILELNKEEKWVRVQPGVNLDELNQYLAPHGLFFGPETSTSNRCMIGGMAGNNSCGSHSILYGTTRDHVLEMHVLLSNGEEVTFKSLTNEEFESKCRGNTLESTIYRFLKERLSDKEIQEEIRREFPKPSIRRRNTGYAVDELLETAVFTEGKPPFNMCKLLCGSEGTLAFTLSLKLNLVDLPPPVAGVLAVHLNTIDEACRATIIARKYNPGAIELLDDIVLQCTKENPEQQKNRFFVEGNPGAIIVVEWNRNTKEEIEHLAAMLTSELKNNGYGYHFPLIFGADIKKIWALRKAGLGLLANVPGDPKAVACIEDTAVDIHDQPDFIADFQKILDKYDKKSVFYAHIGDGEIHLRPILDLKQQKDRELFYTITDEVATLVKKYRGSLSGEHGDGRVRGEFIRKMVGDKNYQLLCDLKATFDPHNIFNPGKIVHTPKMNESLRYENNQITNEFDTVFDFSETQGILRMAEKCNGTGDCRKSHIIGGTMCPSYMATREEKDTTRARANILREFLTRSHKKNKFDHEEIKHVMDLCLSCKGCKSECPSNVDVAMMKAEFLYQYYQSNGIPFRTRMIGHFVRNNALAARIPALYNLLMKNGFISKVAKKILGIAPERNLPLLHRTTLRKWYNKNKHRFTVENPKKKVYLFCDEYTDYNDTDIGITAIKLLTKLGYQVEIPAHVESGRTFISKGMLMHAKKVAMQNVSMLKDIVHEDIPLVGIEPSAILTFRDEYPLLVDKNLKAAAQKLAQNCLMIDEFLAKEIFKGNISKDSFTGESRKVKIHGHCHQKALASVEATKKILSLPENYQVEVIPSGCCGMAGSFGYEAEHYEISMRIGELVLFPAIRKSSEDVLIAAPGTSCRHQIKDGTGRKALHPVEILYDALTQ